jgi:hypothetical protein
MDISPRLLLASFVFLIFHNSAPEHRYGWALLLALLFVLVQLSDCHWFSFVGLLFVDALAVLILLTDMPTPSRTQMMTMKRLRLFER